VDQAELNSSLNDLNQRLEEIANGPFALIDKQKRLKSIEDSLSTESVWSNLELSQSLNKEKSSLEKALENYNHIKEKVSDNLMLFEMASEESDDEAINEILQEYSLMEQGVIDLEFRRMFTNKMDPSSAYVDIQSGSGGTEAQDWAEMLLRMYSKWAESRGFKISVTEISHGEVAGIKSASLHVEGDHAYGWLRTETGIHRLVRKSPFDSGNRRHTSFASVFISPEVDDSIEIEINPSDIRIDTYRASGAGGQHVNKTDSAVRLTHEPSGVVAQCQSDRSQHKNKENAFKQLKSKLYELELQKQNEERQVLEESKSDIGWGSQIRSYVLDQSRIKDLRTGYETGNTSAVLNGEIDEFIKCSLNEGV
jgi:peptide chain release factor 2